jgi:hypothetical protein
LPPLGYDPEQGPKAGIKFVGRNLGGTGLTLDFGMTAALEGQQSTGISFIRTARNVLYNKNAVH